MVRVRVRARVRARLGVVVGVGVGVGVGLGLGLVALLEGRELERHGRLQTAHLELHAVGLRRDGASQ